MGLYWASYRTMPKYKNVRPFLYSLPSLATIATTLFEISFSTLPSTNGSNKHEEMCRKKWDGDSSIKIKNKKDGKTRVKILYPPPLHGSLSPLKKMMLLPNRFRTL